MNKNGSSNQITRKTVFIDGQSGTTGLQIKERLETRTDIELLQIPYEDRRDPDVKKSFLNNADLVILCLPDQAARDSAALVENPKTKVLDASSAHRTTDGWLYGLPEIDKQRRALIAEAQRVSNPGCYPTGFILSVRPLIEAGLLGSDYPATMHAISGYSGGGKKLIEAYQQKQNNWAARPYSLSLGHKHLPEMQKYSGLDHRPIFNPMVGDYYNGMVASVPIFTRLLKQQTSRAAIHKILADYYAEEACVQVMPLDSESNLDEGGFLSPLACNGTNRLEMFVFGHDEQLLLCTRYDNLGKGASGAAVQNMNLMLGADENLGTDLRTLATAVYA